MNQIIPLDAVQKIAGALVGSKAMSIIRMKKIGLRVPGGFCILGSAYREHIEKNDLLPRIESMLSKLQTKSVSKKILLAKLRQAIINAPISDILKKEMENNYNRLSSKMVAVRSSATAEDLPEHSFAGQYETYLDITTLFECLDAVKKCWASLWTERAYEYREKNGFHHLNVNMAVIVQELVEADASGVLFTADPVTGQSDQMVVEACIGLGDALVSGKITPDRYLLNKKSLQILSESDADKKIVSGTFLNDSTIRKLAASALKAEKALGSPQDMEWAIKDSNIFFLQSRPITTLTSKKSIEDRQIWTNANAGEVLPDIVTPLSWSVVQQFVNALFDSIFSRVGIDLEGHSLFGQIAGRVYFNLNTLAGAFRHFPGYKNMDITSVLGGAQGRLGELNQFKIPKEDVTDIKFNFAKMLLKFPGFIYLHLFYSPKKCRRLIEDIGKNINRIQKINYQLMSDEALAGSLRNIREEMMHYIRVMAATAFSMLFYTNLDKICRQWFKDEAKTFANRLLAGMGNMDSAEAGLELWQLAVIASKDEILKKTILDKDSWRTKRKKISGLQGGSTFLDRWDQFMHKHGHHTRGEIELSNPRWSETPDDILDFVRGYLKNLNRIDPIENYQRRAADRIKLARYCSQELRNPVKQIIFKFCLKRAQHGSVHRENLKSIAIRYIRIMRFLTLEIGERLVKKGVTKARDDIFFLGLDEIEPAMTGKLGTGVKASIATRQNEYRRNLTLIPPKVIIGKFDPNNFIPDAEQKSTAILTGLAVSPGVVTGKARVILRASTGEKVLPGEILVAPFTDPGWTPYFITAAAIVMDQGGLLSHGSIVAREYGIPAVVNVGVATKIIKTGQTIQIDGNRGEVKIIK